jgi:ornithine carbamoyltransferase
VRHFLRDDDLTPQEQGEVLALAAQLKTAPYDSKPLVGPKTVAMIFDKPTLRTQSSFAAGIAELGGFPMFVDGNLAGIGTRETVHDVAKVLGRQASAIVWRTGDQSRIDEMAHHAGVPVVNALTDQYHPCQLLADLQTVIEHKGSLAGLKVTFLGDTASNMASSFLLAGTTAGMHVVASGPGTYEPTAAVLDRAEEIAGRTGGSATFVRSPQEAVAGADVVVTDTWVSMGKEEEAEGRGSVLGAWQLDAELLDHADPEAIVLHCLPAYRGKEITAEVLDGPRSVIWDESENRRHAQKAILTWLLERT